MHSSKEGVPVGKEKGVASVDYQNLKTAVLAQL
jgi:hypothetical protein